MHDRKSNFCVLLVVIADLDAALSKADAEPESLISRAP
jgi:hypothetical protein